MRSKEKQMRKTGRHGNKKGKQKKKLKGKEETGNAEEGKIKYKRKERKMRRNRKGKVRKQKRDKKGRKGRRFWPFQERLSKDG